MFQVQRRTAGWRSFLKWCALVPLCALPCLSQAQGQTERADVDVDASLQSLELRLAAAGEPLALLDASGEKIGFSAHVRQYFATVPFPAASAFITATPAVAADISIDGEAVQRRAEVRIFRAEQDKGEDVAGKETSVDLPGNEDRFAFDIEVSVQPSVDGGEVVMQTYSLTLTRALPADAELRVYRAADGERETPITEDLNFGADDDDMDLILILSRGGGGSGYSIRDIGISGSDDDRFAVTNGGQIDTGAGGFETQVTLRRVDVNAAEDVPYSLTFTATPARPPADDANPPSATIAGTLKANTNTLTKIQATYQGEHQDEKEPISPGAVIRVSENGPVTIQLRVARSGGGERNFGQSDFSLLFTVAGEEATAVPVEECDCYSLEIAASGTGPLSLTVAAEDEDSLGARISTPPALAFTLSFESPRAVIRPAVGPNPLLAFREPFFAFVGEDNKLPLEVVLMDDSTPLANRDIIFGGLQLTATLDVVGGGAITAAVAIAAADADDRLPGRDLVFAIEGPKDNVTVRVAVADGGEDELVNVAALSFEAHFLSLKHPDVIEFRGDAEVFDIVLQGEDPDNDSWTFEIINSAEFEGHGYRVEEVALTGTEAIYEPSTAESAVETRHLRVTGDATAVNSRIVLEFEYIRGQETAGVFTRTIRLTSGREAGLEVAVIPGTLVLPQGGSGQVRILVSNLAPDDDPTAGAISLLPDHADVTAELQGSGRPDPINNRFEQTLEVRAAADAGRPEYTVRVEVRLPGKDVVGTEFRVDINDAPQYEGKTALTVYESGHGSVLEFPLSIVDPDGGMRFLDATELYLQVIGFEDSFKVASSAGHANRYFDLAFSGISAVGQEVPPNGKRNSLALTLTLSGKLATPFNSVVELRLFGVTDGFDDFEQLLTVGVKNRPPRFELAQTQGVKVFLEREAATLELLEELEPGARVLVLGAPADLVVKFDPAEDGEEGNGKVTLRRLHPGSDEDDLSNEVKLAALDAAGGLTEVSIQVERPPLLPRIVPPPPLLIAEGQSGTRTLRLAGGTGLNVTWTIAVAGGGVLGDFIEDDYKILLVAGGHAELRLTLADSVVAGDEFDLLVTAYVGEDAGGYRRTARLPVLVVAETAKPHLKLRAIVSDQNGAAMVVSSFAPTELLSIEVELEGEVPSIYEGDDATAPSFQISIFKLDASGASDSAVEPLSFPAASAVVGGELEIEAVLVGEDDITELNLNVGDAVRVSVGHLPQTDSAEVSDTIIAGASLVLRVSAAAAGKDEDNDGLADGGSGESEPAVLGPIAAAVARVTDGGVASRGDEIEVSLSLGETSRLLGLGECGGVSLTLTLTLSDDGDGAAASLSGCSGAAIDAGPLFAAETLVALDLEEGVEYQLLDLAATFDSSEAGGGGFLVISLPLDPQQPYVVYRYDEDGNDGDGGWVPVEAAGLPGQPGQAGLGGGGQGVLADFESDCGSCFYDFDLDRDGAVQLLLLLVPMDAAAGSEFALDDAALEGRQLEISGDKTETIALVGLDDLAAVRITGAATEGDNPNIEVRVLDDGTVELIGLRRTANGPEELLIEALDGGQVVAAISLYVRVPNQPPEVSFMLPSGEELTTSLALAANGETVLTVIVEDADGDQSFVLDLMDEDGKVANGRGLASLVSRLSLGVDEGSDYMISHELTLSSMGIGAGEFGLKVRVTDLGDGSQTFKTLSGCVLDGRGQCPVPTGGGGTDPDPDLGPSPMADRDGNSLIEIDSLLMLHNMRYNLEGTSYRTGTTSVGNSFGCPDTGCIGYELTRDLDFDADKDGSTWSGSADEGYTLDSGDRNADYFPVQGGAGGWLPIGGETNPFVAVFDGNSRTISGLAIRRDQTYVGLFGRTGGAVIRNLGLIDNLADYTGSNDDFIYIYIGGLVGLQRYGLITASYATGVAAGGAGDRNLVGGLVGLQFSSSITASYATGDVAGGDGDYDEVGGLVGSSVGSGTITASYAMGDVDGGDGAHGGDGFDHVGGLVGWQEGGSITASYATGAAAGGGGADDEVGGLVGSLRNVSITASYATGDVDGGAGDIDSVGGLVGWREGGSITASYATGAAAGGDGNEDYVGGLVGWQRGGSITESYATGAAAGGDGGGDRVGGLVGYQEDGGSITASYATGVATGGNGGDDAVGGLVGVGSGAITASYATGDAAGGNGNDDLVGGLVGDEGGGSITASYATGDADGGGGNNDNVGGLVGAQYNATSITASYATGAAAGGYGDYDHVGGLVGWQGGGSITASYATGDADGGDGGDDSVGGLVGLAGGAVRSRRATPRALPMAGTVAMTVSAGWWVPCGSGG